MHQFKEPSYIKQYHWKTLLIKMSGKEFNEETFANIEQLLRNGVKVILAYGWWITIDLHWNEYSKQLRVKVEGVWVTSQDVLEYGVMPAYEELYFLLKSRYLVAIDKKILAPEDIKCDYRDIWKYGEVWKIKEITGVDFNRAINLIWFVWNANGHYVNINADEIVTYMVKHFSDKLNEVLFLSDQPGLLNKKWELVSVILKSNIENILSGIDPHITVDGGMVKKLEEIQLILNRVPKVVLTMWKGLYDEINDWRGKGTMFIDDSQLSHWSLKDRLMFYEIFNQYVHEKIFRSRSWEELENIMKSHTVVSVKNTILWWFSLTEVWNHHMLVECMWSSYIGTGLCWMILDTAENIAYNKWKKLFLITSNEKAGASFEKNGFRKRGTVWDCVVRRNCWEIQEYFEWYTLKRSNSFVYMK